MIKKFFILALSFLSVFIYSQKNFYKEISLSKENTDGILKKFDYKSSISCTLFYDSLPNSFVFKDNQNTYKQNLNFVFDGTGSDAFLFQKLKDKILILKFSYEYSDKILIYKISNSNFNFLREILINTENDKDTWYKISVLSRKNGVEIVLNNKSKKRKYSINY